MRYWKLPVPETALSISTGNQNVQRRDHVEPVMSAARIVPAWVLSLTAVLTVTLSLLPTRSASAVGVGQVTNWCSSLNVDGNSKLCHAYVAAALQLLRTPDPVLNGRHQICAPEADLTKIVTILVSCSKQHPDAQNKDFTETTGQVLADRYLC
jgi:hypothetical protein